MLAREIVNDYELEMEEYAEEIEARLRSDFDRFARDEPDWPDELDEADELVELPLLFQSVRNRQRTKAA